VEEEEDKKKNKKLFCDYHGEGRVRRFVRKWYKEKFSVTNHAMTAHSGDIRETYSIRSTWGTELRARVLQEAGSFLTDETQLEPGKQQIRIVLDVVAKLCRQASSALYHLFSILYS